MISSAAYGGFTRRRRILLIASLREWYYCQTFPNLSFTFGCKSVRTRMSVLSWGVRVGRPAGTRLMPSRVESNKWQTYSDNLYLRLPKVSIKSLNLQRRFIPYLCPALGPRSVRAHLAMTVCSM
jgi:hypothetical protein